MNFLNEIESHLETFESDAKAEIQRFVAYVRSKYTEPAPAVVAAPAPIAPNGELTIAQPAPAVVDAPAQETTVAEEAPAPIEAAPAAEETPVDQPVEEATE
jgi:hypothetical protein